MWELPQGPGCLWPAWVLFWVWTGVQDLTLSWGKPAQPESRLADAVPTDRGSEDQVQSNGGEPRAMQTSASLLPNGPPLIKEASQQVTFANHEATQIPAQ